MKNNTFDALSVVVPAVAAALLLSLGMVSPANADDGHSHSHGDSSKQGLTGLAQQVVIGTRNYRDVSVAMAEGWGSNNSCVSGPNVGAMGIHYSNVGLLEDAELNPQQPEALIYEFKNHRLRLVGVEFIVFKSLWEAAHGTGPLTTPSLMGQRFNFVDKPNRYGLEPLYELHVWAWRDNPLGTFVDWNPRVSCDEFTPEPAP